MEELLMRGHRRVALITRALDVRTLLERVRAYRGEFPAGGLVVDEDLTLAGGFEMDYAKSEVIRLFSRSPEPTAFLTGRVPAPAGALRALRQLRREPGWDVATVALDEWPMFDVFTPDLASVSRDSDKMGTASARLLLDMLDGAVPGTTIIDSTSRASLTSPSTTGRPGVHAGDEPWQS